LPHPCCNLSSNNTTDNTHPGDLASGYARTESSSSAVLFVLLHSPGTGELEARL
jgi:hypothetical protein